MKIDSSATLSQKLVRLRRKMARRWSSSRKIDDPELLAISQELDEVLTRFVAAASTRNGPVTGDWREM